MNINIAGVESAIVADKSGNMSTQTSKGCDHLSGSGRLDFEIVPVVYNLLQKKPHIQWGVKARYWVGKSFFEQNFFLFHLLIEGTERVAEWGK